MRSRISTLIVMSGAFALTACGGVQTTTSKPMPGGEPDDMYSAISITDASQEPAKKEPAFKKTITIPKNAKEKNGLRMITSIPGLKAGEDYKVKAGNSFLVNTLVRNFTSNSVRVAYGTDQRFDIVVYTDPDQRDVYYRWGEHRNFDQAFQEMMIAGGASISRMLEVPTTSSKVVMEGMENDLGKPLIPGTYYLWGTNEGDPLLADGPIKVIVEEQ
ncbi:MAG TPA: BsuPI-related putative proteinase inhibitor [Candidatus Sumerlaeota bacterium]|nr:BsuPI-related putative proteinase inhibitor [Candidatus Sumerlaeota bacterium]HNM46678.1 BsuPI-related putative proteinase inhibitor [Candidatus Sumerlaeota bacterium]